MCLGVSEERRSDAFSIALCLDEFAKGFACVFGDHAALFEGRRDRLQISGARSNRVDDPGGNRWVGPPSEQSSEGSRRRRIRALDGVGTCVQTLS